MDILQKEAIIAAFEREKINVEITENKKGQIVVSRMCELRKEQVYRSTQGDFYPGSGCKPCVKP